MIITGGQDNVQAVAGQFLGFFAEIGCAFPPFPYVAHSRGWTAEDMEANVTQVANSKDLQDGVRSLVDRALHTADRLLATADLDPLNRGGRGPGVGHAIAASPGADPAGRPRYRRHRRTPSAPWARHRRSRNQSMAQPTSARPRS